MAKKRFTDIEIWDKEWFMDLTPKLKCLIRYLFDSCDSSGVWDPNWRLASLHIGERVSMADLDGIPKDQWEVINDGKIYLPDFISFQYGTLSEACAAHKPIFRDINKNNLCDRVFNRVSNTLQEKEKEKDKEEEEEKEKETPKNNLADSNLYRKPIRPTKDEVWFVVFGSGGTKEMAKAFYSKYEATGWFLNGSPITNFKPLAQKFVDSWKRNDKAKERNVSNGGPTLPTIPSIQDSHE